jgi:hypothetical protein
MHRSDDTLRSLNTRSTVFGAAIFFDIVTSNERNIFMIEIIFILIVKNAKKMLTNFIARVHSNLVILNIL